MYFNFNRNTNCANRVWVFTSRISGEYLAKMGDYFRICSVLVSERDFLSVNEGDKLGVLHIFIIFPSRNKYVVQPVDIARFLSKTTLFRHDFLALPDAVFVAAVPEWDGI